MSRLQFLNDCAEGMGLDRAVSISHAKESYKYNFSFNCSLTLNERQVMMALKLLNDLCMMSNYERWLAHVLRLLHNADNAAETRYMARNLFEDNELAAEAARRINAAYLAKEINKC